MIQLNLMMNLEVIIFMKNNNMKTLAEELKEIALIKAIELDKERELAVLNKEKLEQERINLILQKTYNYFESNWIKKAKKAALYGQTNFNVELNSRGRNESIETYDKTSDCYLITGTYMSELYDIIMNKIGKDYFNSLCKKIEEKGFKNVKITCKSWDWTTFSCESITSYSIYLSGEFK